MPAAPAGRPVAVPTPVSDPPVPTAQPRQAAVRSAAPNAELNRSHQITTDE